MGQKYSQTKCVQRYMQNYTQKIDLKEGSKHQVESVSVFSFSFNHQNVVQSKENFAVTPRPRF